MKLSNKGRYGVKAIFDIAFHNHGKPTQIKDIAERQAIPPRFLEQIFQDLKKAGIVTSKRGPRGGYQLAMEPADIRVGDIIRALEGPTVLSTVADRESQEGDATSQTMTEEAFEDLTKQIEACWKDDLIRAPADIFDLARHRDDLTGREGMGEKSVTNLLAAIEQRRKIGLDRFIFALGIRQIGQATAKLAFVHHRADGRAEVVGHRNDDVLRALRLDGAGHEQILGRGRASREEGRQQEAEVRPRSVHAAPFRRGGRSVDWRARPRRVRG